MIIHRYHCRPHNCIYLKGNTTATCIHTELILFYIITVVS